VRIAYVMDPFSTVNVDKDTTFAFMLEAQKRGHDNYFLEAKDLYVKEGKSHGKVKPVKVQRVQSAPATLSAEERVPLSSFDAVLMRKDPPFDMDYIFATYILDHAGPKTYVGNRPSGIRDANEKMAILRFNDVIVPTIVTKDQRLLKEFLHEQNGQMIIKPLDGRGGDGIFLVKEGDRNVNSLFEMMTLNGVRYIMAQRYIPEVRTGDKRVIIIDGEAVGGLWRIPAEDDNRANMHVGGSAAKADLDERDHHIAAVIKPYLMANGLDFVGIDVIGGYLTEVNVTSPTGVQEISRFNGTDVAAQTIDMIERKVKALQG
jgi:glutathione synthase